MLSPLPILAILAGPALAPHPGGLHVAAPTPRGVQEVHVTLYGDLSPELAEALQGGLRASLADLGIGVEVRRALDLEGMTARYTQAREDQGGHPGRAVLWLRTGDEGRLQLRLLPPASEEVYVRTLPDFESVTEASWAEAARPARRRSRC